MKARVTSDEIIRYEKYIFRWGMFTLKSLCGKATGRPIISGLDLIAIYQIYSIMFC